MAKGVQFGRPRPAASIRERLAVVPGRPRPAGHSYSVCQKQDLLPGIADLHLEGMRVV
jgi:hypothetical protein